MSKHETTFTSDGIDPDMLRRTETAVLAFMAKNDGRMPTQRQVNQTVCTSFTRLAERDEIFAMLASRSDGPEATDGDPKAAKTARRCRKSDEPETGDLPMAPATAAAHPSADT